ncbi:class I SAM-dependent methyltransferase [Modestobacter sp. VKM Ac-2984]|uniref:class I SAM-dependent methyltransferase n=1 Tax=Modestobacter sp. VKM Ac-2984 TaxID=3004138 RepID=UPI0022AA8D83|nr:methyltransferase domain-containing protein [Modestobacter sp. VKM Ac-2984]MCZ2818068.1 methyltransferase domain-containing protein [Modestobacter sp. VKM Ac-2984]
MRAFDELIAEGAAVSTEGWDFSWFAGRATEERPPWGWCGLLADRLGRATRSLDLQTGGGEVYAEALTRAARAPGRVAATESWPPNLLLARERLGGWGGEVAEVADDGPLPFSDATFDLVSSRHPTVQRWDEMARVLAPGGTHLCQGVGSGTHRVLAEALVGPRHDADEPTAERTAEAARSAGLLVVAVRSHRCRVEFGDIGAVVHFLRKVVWTVPGFSVERYRSQLAEVHRQIERDGTFVSWSQRYLIEVRQPR